MPTEEITHPQEYNKVNIDEVSTNDTSNTENEAVPSDTQVGCLTTGGSQYD